MFSEHTANGSPARMGNTDTVAWTCPTIKVMNGSTAMEWQARAREHFETILRDAESEWIAGEQKIKQTAEEAEREHLAEWLNQGLRRVRQAPDIRAAAALAVELSAAHAARCAVFLFGDQGSVEAVEQRALGDGPLRFDSNEAAAFRAAVETKDPVVAMGTPGEVSGELAGRLDQEAPERVFLFPLPMRSGVKGVLFATAVEQPALLEVIAGVTSLQMDLLDTPPLTKRADLIEIAGAAKTEAGPQSGTQEGPAAARSWNDLTPGEQAIHLKAQRFARRRVAEIRLENPDKIQAGISKRDLYSELRVPLDQARQEFRTEFLTASPTMVDYLYLEIVRGLAGDDDHLLGPQFPGRLV